ncbi:MAG: class I SAM-dependent methyltransferase [Spirochaetota bacterium]
MSKSIVTSAANRLPFEKDYWNLLYGDTFTIDGIYNAKEHIAYLSSLFRLMNVHVSSLGDFGFGKGILLQEACRVFQPRKVIAVDPSETMVTQILQRKWLKKFEIAIFHGTIETYLVSHKIKKPFDLCFCNSVFQYIKKDIPQLLEKIAHCVRYLYFSVPTTDDYARMQKKLGFSDPYAYARSRNYYIKALKPHFSFVSYNLLESKYNKKSNYAFTDELFRF